MCNIAGYIGDKPAAPILIEMLCRQQGFDGGFATGIATLHNGKIYWKKFIGNVEEFLKETDLSEFPGTIGIAHTRPIVGILSHSHPYPSESGMLAMVTNGGAIPETRAEEKNCLTRNLNKKGYEFITRFNAESSTAPQLENGEYVQAVDVMVNLVENYINEGNILEESITKAMDDMYSERVCVVLKKDIPDALNVCRITRPMELLLGKGECYIATTRFGFPEDIEGEMMSLPNMHTVTVTKNGYTVSPYTIKSDKVAEITPMTYKVAYDRIVEMLKEGKDNPKIYDDFENTLHDMPELWNEQTICRQHAKVVYDVLWQLKCEGRLKSFLAPQTQNGMTRNLINMYID